MIRLGRLGLWWRNRGIDRAHRLHRLSHEPLYTGIDDVIARFRGAGGLKHRFQAYKLAELDALLAEFKPESILELGSGSSTAIFARYVRQGAGRHSTSVDESEKWLSNARSLASVSADDSRFDWIVKAPVSSDSRGRTCVGYGIKPENYDFVFIDGPSLKIDGVQRKDAVNDDVFRLIETSPPRIIVVDARYATVKALEQITRDAYEFKPSGLLDRFPAAGYRYFSVFIRKAVATNNS